MIKSTDAYPSVFSPIYLQKVSFPKFSSFPQLQALLNVLLGLERYHWLLGAHIFSAWAYLTRPASTWNHMSHFSVFAQKCIIAV